MSEVDRLTANVLRKLEDDGWKPDSDGYKSMKKFLLEAKDEIEKEAKLRPPVDPSTKFVAGEFYRVAGYDQVECLFATKSGRMLYSSTDSALLEHDQLSVPFSEGLWHHVPNGEEIEAAKSRLLEIEIEASDLRVKISEMESK